MGQTGQFRNRITYQRLVNSHDAFGGPLEEWEDVRKSWCSIEGVTGREKFKGDQNISEMQFRLRCRYASDVESLTWRVKTSDGKLWNIVSIQPDNKRQYMLLYCFLNSYDQQGHTGGVDYNASVQP